MTAEDTDLVAMRGAMVPAKPMEWPRWVRTIRRGIRRALRRRTRVRAWQMQQLQKSGASHEPAWSCRKAQVNADLQSGMVR
jgi:hypothetical protein